MNIEKKLPEIRFKRFSGEWVERNWGDTVDISTSMVDPRDCQYGELFHVGPGNIESFAGRFYKNVLKVKDSNLISGKFHFKKGDIIYGKINPQLAKYVIAPFEGLASADAYVLNAKNGVVQNYLFAILHTEDFYKYTVSVSSRTGMPKINRDELNIYNYMAPFESEQTQIGHLFQKLHALINQHQQKHAKLSNIKKSMLEKMFPKQEESIPEIRFKGFSGEWEKKKLGDIGDTYTGLSGKAKDDFGHGQGRFVTYLNVFSNAISNENLVESIELDTNQNEVRKGDVFFTTSSEIPEEVGMSSVWMSEIKNVYLNSFCFGFRPKQKLDNYYLAYLLRSNSFREKVVFLAQGISRYNISKTKVMDIKISIPKLSEQKKIGLYFQRLDTLINQHQQQITKLNNIKQACLSKMFV